MLFRLSLILGLLSLLSGCNDQDIKKCQELSSDPRLEH